PLLLGAVGDERRPHHLNTHEADQTRRPCAYHLLVDDRLAHDVGALAAVVARPAHGDVTGFVELSLPPLAARDAPRDVEVEGPLVWLPLRHVEYEPTTDFALKAVLL